MFTWVKDGILISTTLTLMHIPLQISMHGLVDPHQIGLVTHSSLVAGLWLMNGGLHYKYKNHLEM